MTSGEEEIDVDEDVCLRTRLTSDDVPALVKYLNNPTIFRNTLKIPSPYTNDDGENFVKIVQTVSSDLFFTIRLKTTGELIGCCGFHRHSEDNERQAEIGYWLAEPFWHRGLMTKVVRKAIEVVRKRWPKLVRLQAGAYPWNTASMCVMEKCGFQFEGVHRKALHKNGEDIDEHIFALIFD